MRRIKKMSFVQLIERNKQEILSNAESVKKIEEKIDMKHQKLLSK
ncbi:FbpB family small basic protein [Bacillus sporothermodurans]|uniref:FbpB family small basic protein n=1 Tax=Heyndrickxia sporothermodurans TaxID=46224 RepID=A0AB37HDL8_9BACI|nr:FbpB family small basic protein [Heyndrickxia sporothermodurans]MBL5772984.1 FbpB family small basic protein [Heyndrickxia sporothermodurans]MBL5776461.1 FbpB family small basic protein [Heyndrickxia sporothermodurans]MBL5779977.1 FbpB family small basic protein [Heyndrickxia sporothermodurans]MBL5783572.1 FbpB family small basic protein [Heyndrickxia sporothermodurans]